MERGVNPLRAGCAGFGCLAACLARPRTSNEVGWASATTAVVAAFCSRLGIWAMGGEGACTARYTDAFINALLDHAASRG